MVQSHLRHPQANTTADEYIQELPESVQQMVGSVFTMLTREGLQMVNGAFATRYYQSLLGTPSKLLIL